MRSLKSKIYISQFFDTVFLPASHKGPWTVGHWLPEKQCWEATNYKARRGSWKGAVSAQKALQGPETSGPINTYLISCDLPERTHSLQLNDHFEHTCPPKPGAPPASSSNPRLAAAERYISPTRISLPPPLAPTPATPNTSKRPVLQGVLFKPRGSRGGSEPSDSLPSLPSRASRFGSAAATTLQLRRAAHKMAHAGEKYG